MQKLSLAVIFGGRSSEHSISCISAHSIISHLNKEKYDLHIIGIAKDGSWFLYEDDINKIKDESWINCKELKKAFISPDTSIKGIVVLNGDKAEQIKLDAVFPVLHGMYGEDGTIQGLFEMAGIPYVGPDVAASSNCMDKVVTKTLFEHAQIPQCKWSWCDIRDFSKSEEKIIAEFESLAPYPLFVKPSRAGSSIGIKKAKNRDELVEAIKEASMFDNKIVIEEFVNAREIEVAVMGNFNPFASVCGEILPSGDFYDFSAKYIDNKSEVQIPANLSEKETEEIRTLAVKAYKALCCEGLSRVDFFIDKKNKKIMLNEINTIPGFTDISMFPKLFDFCGYSYSTLIDELIKYAVDRGNING